MQAFTGRGLAEEASVASIDWAFEHLGWDEVIHCISPRNTASQRLAERLGARNVGPTQLPAPYDDIPVELWRQSRAEWNARQGA